MQTTRSVRARRRAARQRAITRRRRAQNDQQLVYHSSRAESGGRLKLSLTTYGSYKRLLSEEEAEFWRRRAEKPRPRKKGSWRRRARYRRSHFVDGPEPHLSYSCDVWLLPADQELCNELDACLERWRQRGPLVAVTPAQLAECSPALSEWLAANLRIELPEPGRLARQLVRTRYELCHEIEWKVPEAGWGFEAGRRRARWRAEAALGLDEWEEDEPQCGRHSARSGQRKRERFSRQRRDQRKL